jgi:hypothetical protein
MTPAERTVAHLRIAAEAAAAHHAARHPHRLAHVARLLRRRDDYLSAWRAMPPRDPRGHRARHLAACAAWRAMAYEALAEGHALLAWHRRAFAARSWREAMTVRVA